jgi:hypothetical protein
MYRPTASKVKQVHSTEKPDHLSLYWSDIKRWEIGKNIYPIVVKDHLGGIIETKFPNGFLDYYNLLPIPVSELSLNPKLEQNPGW